MPVGTSNIQTNTSLWLASWHYTLDYQDCPLAAQ